jgi:hypothetical protein
MRIKKYIPVISALCLLTANIAYSGKEEKTQNLISKNFSIYDSIIADFNVRKNPKDSMQIELDKKVLNHAIKKGLLKDGSTIDNITLKTKIKLCDEYTFEDAIKLKYLPNEAKISDLTLDIRDKMRKNNHLKNYTPFGEIIYSINN